MLVLTASAALAGLGAATGELQASTLRLLATALVALLAPLFWPGRAATPAATARRVLVWSLAAAGGAAALALLFGHPLRTWSRLLAPCALLAALLLLAHALAAWAETRLRASFAEPLQAPEAAGRLAALLLALLGSLPLMLGPAAEALSARYSGIIDAVLATSPLTHLAVASGNDLLRNAWPYQHSNLAALQFDYPGPAQIAWLYAGACGLLALATLVAWRSAASRPPPHP